jgi:hypothetical protein
MILRACPCLRAFAGKQQRSKAGPPKCAATSRHGETLRKHLSLVAGDVDIRPVVPGPIDLRVEARMDGAAVFRKVGGGHR